MARIDPLRNFPYRLKIGNITQAGFSEVSIPETAIDAVDYGEGTDPPHVRKLSGLTRYSNVTLKTGVTVAANALELFKWHSDVSSRQVTTKRKRVVIVVRDEAGADRARFVITDAWPVNYDPSDLNAKGNEVMIELLELANDRQREERHISGASRAPILLAAALNELLSRQMLTAPKGSERRCVAFPRQRRPSSPGTIRGCMAYVDSA